MAAGLEDLFGREPQPEGIVGEPDESLGERRAALVVAAHPDDADFGAAATAHLLARQGWEVRYVVVTDGSKGSDDPQATPAALVAMREQEQRRAAEILGVADVCFLGYTDGELEYTRELLGAITREIRSYQPFAVFTHDPEPVIIAAALADDGGDAAESAAGFVNHRDHRITGLATVDAVYPTARDRLNFPEHLDAGLAPHKVRELYLWGSNQPNVRNDVTDVIETKIAALVAHESQFSAEDGFLDMLREYWRDGEGRYREAFRRVVLFR